MGGVTLDNYDGIEMFAFFFSEDFDIKAKDCTASTIDITTSQ